ncbi:hypothetical protein QYM36_010214 [Artemia franciscana]|uniref:Uncharacterized protein n=1 Tax=Artemia franciscana TaxID=6661 RepID=A0AA88HWM8_ARTSF|nr:hypothetical protein QYM36_010214 [Artemia franciscana]
MALIIGAFATVLEPSGDMGLAGTTGGGAGAEFRDGGTSQTWTKHAGNPVTFEMDLPCMSFRQSVVLSFGSVPVTVEPAGIDPVIFEMTLPSVLFRQSVVLSFGSVSVTTEPAGVDVRTQETGSQQFNFRPFGSNVDKCKIFEKERKRLSRTSWAFAAELNDRDKERRKKAMTRAEEIQKLLDPSLTKLRSKKKENGLRNEFYKAIERYDDNFILIYTDGSFKLNQGSGCSIAIPRRKQVICIRTESKSSIQAEYEGILRALENPMGQRMGQPNLAAMSQQGPPFDDGLFDLI